jgi:ATP-dependent DNA ligase
MSSPGLRSKMSYLEKPWALQIAVARCAHADGAQVTMKLESPSATQSTGPGEYAQPPRPRTRAQSGLERTKTGFIAIPEGEIMRAIRIMLLIANGVPTLVGFLILAGNIAYIWRHLHVRRVAPIAGIAFVAKGLGAYSVEVSRVQFIPPALAKLRSSPPAGEGWLFDLKFDGWRVQLHKAGLSSAAYGRNSGDLTRRFPRIAAAVLGLPAKSCIIDAELIAAGVHGQPDFLALLHGRHVPTCVYAFDPLELQGRDVREQPLVQRHARLQALLTRTKSDLLRFSESFPDANALLAECSRRGLEGIVANRKDAAYRSGTRSGWIKVKTSE